MIGLNFVYEKDELLYSLDVHVEVGEQFSLDYLDFDNQSFEDVIDYMEFLEFEQYYFVALEENVRLKRLVTYLSNKVTYPIGIIEWNDFEKLLPSEKITSLQKTLENHNVYKKLTELNTEVVLKNGYRAFRSAVYPNLTKGLLKHLLVDQLDEFLNDNKELQEKIKRIFITRSYRDKHHLLVFQSENNRQDVFDFGIGTLGIYWTLLGNKFPFEIHLEE